MEKAQCLYDQIRLACLKRMLDKQEYRNLIVGYLHPINPNMSIKEKEQVYQSLDLACEAIHDAANKKMFGEK